jgi:hypothetical protein
MARNLMRQRNSGFFLMFIIAISIVAVVSLSFFLRETPIAEVKDVSVNPSTIQVNSQSQISFTIKSNDNKETHYITVFVSASSSVSISKGNTPLPVSDNGSPYFSATLDPSQQSTYYLNIKGSLPNQTSGSTYPINLAFYVDGKQFDNKQVSITVQE